MSVITNLIDMYRRSKAGEPLTPQERSFKKAVLGLLVGVLSAFAPHLPDVFAGRYDLNYWQLSGSVVICIVCLAIAKLWTASTPQEQAAGKLIGWYAEEIDAIVEGSLAVHQLPKAVPPPDLTEPQPVS